MGVAFTGRHCGRDSPGADEEAGVTLDVFTPEGYLTSVPVKEEFSLRRAALLAKAKTLDSSSPEAARILRHLSTTTRFAQKSLCAEASDPAPFFNPSSPPDQQSAVYQSALKAQVQLSKNSRSHHASCWTYAEVGVYPFEIDASLFDKLEFSGLKDLVQGDEAKQAELARAAAAATASSANLETRTLWERDTLALTGRSRLNSHAAGIDFLRWCATDDALRESTFSRLPLGSIDVATAKRACLAKDQVRQALVPYFKERVWDETSQTFAELDVFKDAATKGFSDNEPLSRLDTGAMPPRASRARYFLEHSSIMGAYSKLSMDQRERLDELMSAWETGSSVPGIGMNISVLGATPGSPGSVRFAVVPLTSFHQEKESFGLDKTPLFNFAFRIFLKKQEARLTLAPGDSGSLLTLDGYMPIAALNGVGDDVTSAGASVIALPARRSRNSDGPAAPSSADRKNPKRQGDGEGDNADCG
jgi:hypothetical protein